MVPCIAILYTIIQQDAAVRSQFYFTAAQVQVIWPVPETVDTVDVLLMMGVESTRNL